MPSGAEGVEDFTGKLYYDERGFAEQDLLIEFHSGITTWMRYADAEVSYSDASDPARIVLWQD